MTLPIGSRADDIGCTSNSVTPLSVSFLMFSTKLPITLPSCIRPYFTTKQVIDHFKIRSVSDGCAWGGAPRGLIIDFNLIDDPHNRSIDRAVFHASSHARGAAAY